MAKKSEKLEEINTIFNTEENKIFTSNGEEMYEVDMNAKFIENIKEQSLMIMDERHEGYVLHSVESILLVVIFSQMANCKTFPEIHDFICEHYKWLDKYIKFENGIPSISTIQRVVAFINPKALEEILTNAIKQFNKENKPIYHLGSTKIDDIITVDGKTANSSDRKSSKNGPIPKTNAMSAYSIKGNRCLATEFISEKTNEIPTCPILLDRLNIKDCIVTFDALNTQQDTIKYIVKHKGHYVAPVKGNHKDLHNDIRDYFLDPDNVEIIRNQNYKVVKDYKNNFNETREYGFTDDIDWLFGKENWKNIKSIGFAKRTYRSENGEIKTDVRYYISDLSPDNLPVIIDAIRGEWKIECNLHYYLDVVFGEDKNTCFALNTQKNLNIIRKFVQALLIDFKKAENRSMVRVMKTFSYDFENQIQRLLTYHTN